MKAAVEREAGRLHGGRASGPNGRKPAAAVTGSGSGGRAKSTSSAPTSAAVAVAAPKPPVHKLSKDAYRKRKAQIDEELSRLWGRKDQLESALQDPAVHGNFVELRRVSGELASVNEALAKVEEAWLALEESAP